MNSAQSCHFSPFDSSSSRVSSFAILAAVLLAGCSVDLDKPVDPSASAHQVRGIPPASVVIRSDKPLFAVWSRWCVTTTRELVPSKSVCPLLIVWDDGEFVAGSVEPRFERGVFRGRSSMQMMKNIKSLAADISRINLPSPGPWVVHDAETQILAYHDGKFRHFVFCEAALHNSTSGQKEILPDSAIVKYQELWEKVFRECKVNLTDVRKERTGDFVQLAEWMEGDR